MVLCASIGSLSDAYSKRGEEEYARTKTEIQKSKRMEGQEEKTNK